jgi:hypothetical protein
MARVKAPNSVGDPKFLVALQVAPGCDHGYKASGRPAGDRGGQIQPEITLKVAAVPLKETPVVPLNPWPRISIVFPTLPEVDTRLTNGWAPIFRL